jgi:hypothetical protein
LEPEAGRSSDGRTLAQARRAARAFDPVARATIVRLRVERRIDDIVVRQIRARLDIKEVRLADVVGNDTRRGADATIGEEDYLAVLSEAVDQHRIPVIDVAAQVLQADQRRRFRLALPNRR